MYSYAPQQIQRLSGAGFFFFLICMAFWLLTLVLALRNKNLGDIARFMWVFVIVMLPVIGGLLYLFMTPLTAAPITLDEAAENEARRKMVGVYEKTEWRNR